MTILDFDEFGLLPPGDYAVTLSELRGSSLVIGPTSKLNSWDEVWRTKLVENLEVIVDQLWKVGIEEIFVDGSFAENKDHPNDIDGYFECDLQFLASGDLEHQLNALDPHKIWTWHPDSRRPYRGSPKRQLPMWHQYRVELYPHFGQPSGITDQFGNNLMFPAAFRKSRSEQKQKGIIKIIRTGART